MSQNSLPENVPDAKKGVSDSVAAPGSAGVGDTRLHAFAQRYAVELLFLSVWFFGLSVAKLLWVCA